VHDADLTAVLDADPQLRGGLAGEDLTVARACLLAPSLVVDRGEWRPSVPDDHREHLGFLVLEGALFRSIALADRDTAELLLRGDLLRPWQRLRGHAPLATPARWTVVEPARLVALDRRFTAMIGRWPAVTAAVVGRAIERSRALTVERGIAQLTGVETRLLALLWHLAERSGSRDGDRPTLPARLTHDMLAALVGAYRPAVTTALGALAERGLVERLDSGGWALHGEVPESLRALRELE
jgi:CRP-like cAMP-binding protein